MPAIFTERIEKPDVGRKCRHRSGDFHPAEKFHSKSAFHGGDRHRNIRYLPLAVSARDGSPHFCVTCGEEVRKDTFGLEVPTRAGSSSGPPILLYELRFSPDLFPATRSSCPRQNREAARTNAETIREG